MTSVGIHTTYCNHMHFKPELSAVRWIALFDLLGTKELIREGHEWRVFDAYLRALDGVKLQVKIAPALEYLWFSDTFVIAAPDDSATSFTAVDIAARGLFAGLVLKQIPARGAVGCDRGYVDAGASIAFGPVFLEALSYGDNQDWIGL